MVQGYNLNSGSENFPVPEQIREDLFVIRDSNMRGNRISFHIWRTNFGLHEIMIQLRTRGYALTNSSARLRDFIL